MNNVVDQSTALALKEAGWEKETERVWEKYPGINEWYIIERNRKRWSGDDWLPAPNVTEIGEELTYEDLGKYFCVVVDPELRESPITTLGNFCKWLYSIMHNANEMARVWLWKQGGKP